MNDAPGKMIRVKFAVDPSQWHGSSTETLWAERCGNELRRIDNIPFLTSEVSFGDVVMVSKLVGGVEGYVSTIKKGSHSTYRLVIQGTKAREDRLQSLEELGCLYEIGQFNAALLIAVSVPPEADIQGAYKFFEDGASNGLWDFEEANFQH